MINLNLCIKKIVQKLPENFDLRLLQLHIPIEYNLVSKMTRIHEPDTELNGLNKVVQKSE